VLTQAEVAPFLLRQGLITPASVVEGDLLVLDASRRHANFQVLSVRGPSYVVKQGVGPTRAAAIAREAACYRRLHAQGGRLRRYLPGLCLYQPEAQVLVLELVRDAARLAEHHERRGRFSVALAAALGRALGTLHRLPGAGLPVCGTPWVLALHRPVPWLYHEFSIANHQLIRTMQQFPAFGLLLDELRAEWRATAPIHYDIKGDNLLVAPAGRRHALKIVDWEMAGLGDPGWDVGAVFGEYLRCWLLSIPITGEDPPDRFLELARFPLAKIQPALRRFWQAYTGRAGLAGEAAGELLVRAVRYSAARLLQTAVEQSQTADQLTGHTLSSLQLSFNMLQRPHEAAVHLLGIPWIPLVGR
jgi:aminoglycoside phosphotransferase (APT) family kinase protein